MTEPSGQPAPSAHILIVDDDREIRDLLSRFFAKHGYRVSVAGDGRGMRKVLADAAVDLVILDVMLPGEDGLSLCRGLRASSAVPIVMLTAVGEDVDRIVGLELGADDYVAKPFNPRELLARIRAVLRRAGAPPGGLAGARRADAASASLRFAGWRLDLDRRDLTAADGTLVPLSGGEFGLLAALALHPQRVLSRDQLLDLARGRGAVAFDRSIDVQISRLRRKIERDPHDPALIKTVRGGGYLFAPEVEAS
ncbi:MAG: response regulator [Rhodospirillales bacterium]|nr:response regulator [Rhodospirillales bacterium]